MKVSTLRALRALPPAYKDAVFSVRIAGAITSCGTLHQAQAATANWPQAATATLMTVDAVRQYLAKKALP